MLARQLAAMNAWQDSSRFCATWNVWSFALDELDGADVVCSSVTADVASDLTSCPLVADASGTSTPLGRCDRGLLAAPAQFSLTSRLTSLIYGIN